MNADRHAAAVVRYTDDIALLDDDVDLIRKASQCLIDSIIDDFPYQMVESSAAGASDIHAWTLPDRLQSFQHLYIIRCIRMIHMDVFHL